jgi:hypothetical protein
MTTLRLLNFSCFQRAQVFINLKRLETELRRYYTQFAHYFLYLTELLWLENSRPGHFTFPARVYI